ncbi:MAG TPA: hypothetical protein VEI45_19055 [Mycobacterium sp.]|uniref:hypothetical protein n=1 Tax=Mycobacterium sp. TaxID=1785 RepID=UPI002D2E4891|nr:hypothetical protein [Mycobacterium sp.]HXY66394.1 hypothetical protein [Mycobacterium sp.]
MGHKRSRAVFVGLSAASAAFAAAAMLSAATPPTARADDPLTDITNDVQAELGYAQTAFSQAATDFSSNDPTDGLDQLFVGTDDDVVGVPDILQVGTVDALTGAPVIGDKVFEFSFKTPTTLANATTEAQTWYTDGSNLVTTITNLSPTDYADNALDNALSTADQWILPGEILSIGDFISFGF